MTTTMQSEALERARSGLSTSNYRAIFTGFEAMGIPLDDIKPRENVLTFHAWKALGRSVRKGEHGVKIITYVEMKPKKTEADSGFQLHLANGIETPGNDKKTSGSFRRPKATTVFHISQTDAMDK